ncbi:MAG: hypothetical protein K6U00_01320 [Armatimonadetes bacterium]|nr:hypothetical protein [Armatimonadota bacterium]
MTEYYIPMKTNTHGDALAAAGLARLLDSADAPARIRAEGSYYVIEAQDVDEDKADVLRSKSLYKFLIDKEKAPPSLPAYDLQASRAVEQQKSARRNEINDRKKNQGKSKDSEFQEQLKETARDPEYALYNAFKIMQVHMGANKALKAIHIQNKQLMKQILDEFRKPDRKLPKVELGASHNQLMNPLMAKGCYSLKPSTTARGNPGIAKTDDSEFIQYLRYGGYFSVAVPYLLHSSGYKRRLRRSCDLRMLVPMPVDISLAALEAVIAKLRSGQLVVGRRLKRDVLAALALAELLVEHSEFVSSSNTEFPGLSLSGRTPAEIISGLYVAHYMNTSQLGRNVSELAFVGLPSWFRICSKEDAYAWLGILSEHRKVARALDERVSEEIGLLQQYRCVLQTREDEAFLSFLEFAASYGAYWMSATNNPNKKRMSRLSTSNIERMAKSMAPEIAGILQDPGFQSIARAIRKSTVNAQAQKAMGKKPWREIRYGLIAELNRKRFVKEELLEALGTFIAQYNSENARQREIQKSLEAAPTNVSTQDMESFVRLVDDIDNPALIGSLLCAYATCRETGEAEEESCHHRGAVCRARHTPLLDK